VVEIQEEVTRARAAAVMAETRAAWADVILECLQEAYTSGHDPWD
jgi:hypothetical protein